MFRKSLLLCFSLSLLLCITGIAQSGEREMPFSAGTAYVDPTAGATFFFSDGDLDIDTNGLYGGRIGVFLTDHVSLEGSFEYLWAALKGPVDGSRTKTQNGWTTTANWVDMIVPMVNVNYHFNPILVDGLVPFVYAGVGAGCFSWAGQWESSVAGNYGLGLKYALNDYLGLRADVRNLLTAKPYTNDLVVTLGLSFRYPFARKCAVTPPPPPCPQPPPPPPPPPVADELGEVSRHNIQFAFDSAVIQPVSFSELDAIAAFVKIKPSLTLEVNGYTDTTGTPGYNLKLSQRRAESVEKYLISKGVADEQLVPKGFGEANPCATNETEAGRILNRRVEFKVIAE